MATPSEKSPSIAKFLDRFSQVSFGRKRHTSITEDVCVSCGGDAKEFDSDISRREYSISGMCQKCQDEVFGGED